MKYPLEKYKYYQFKNENGVDTVAAVSTYAGKTVKGTAKCDPVDEFSLEKGKMLAAVRCNQKVSEKRLRRAAKKYNEALKAVDDAIAHFEKMKLYYMDAVDQIDEATAELAVLLENY